MPHPRWNDVHAALHAHDDDMIAFLREIVAIPSYDSQIGPVGEAVANRMHALNFDEVRFDSMGNILGRVGSGPRVLLYDSHIDTVGVGDPTAWPYDPFTGKVENGRLYARGSADEKGSTPPMIYAMAVLKRLGLLDGWTLYYFGNMEEWCDGIAPHALVEHEGIRPDYVIVGESTNMQVYRGHRGRVEISVKFHGRSCHASAPERGDSAVYKALPFIEAVRDLNGHLADDAFLGPGSIAVTEVRSSTPSLNAVPDECSIYIDRRVTVGETKEGTVEELRRLPGGSTAEIEIPMWTEPSYTGFEFPVEKYFPAWALDDDHALMGAARAAFQNAYGREAGVSKWVFSTNATYWMGKAGIPSIGFGPGDERVAHQPDENIPLAEVTASADFYAAIFLALRDQTL